MELFLIVRSSNLKVDIIYFQKNIGCKLNHKNEVLGNFELWVKFCYL